ncbi:MAG: hypothetical protein H7318_14905 [Oligoflexus sp.]|nr:hypothetical protein [Oligoflexus sp.]
MIATGLMTVALTFAPQPERQVDPISPKDKTLSVEEKAIVDLYAAFVKKSAGKSALDAKKEPVFSLFEYNDQSLAQNFTLVYGSYEGGHSFSEPASFLTSAGKLGLLSAVLKEESGKKSLSGLLWCEDKLEKCKPFEPFTSFNIKTMTEASAQKWIGWNLAVASKSKKVVFLDETSGSIEGLLRSQTQFRKDTDVSAMGKVAEFPKGFQVAKDGSKHLTALVVVQGILEDSLIEVELETTSGKPSLKFKTLSSTVNVID